jgi:hypothetical protein
LAPYLNLFGLLPPVAPNIFIIMRGSYLAPTYFKKKRRGACPFGVRGDL